MFFRNNIGVPREFREAMIEHAIEELPNECCGVILGRNDNFEEVIPMRSLRPSPDSYFMDPSQQVEVFSEMEKHGKTLLGIYHSHPNGPPHPSDTDLKLAYHPGVLYFIISLENRDHPELRAFLLDKKCFQEASIIPENKG